MSTTMHRIGASCKEVKIPDGFSNVEAQITCHVCLGEESEEARMIHHADMPVRCAGASYGPYSYDIDAVTCDACIERIPSVLETK